MNQKCGFRISFSSFCISEYCDFKLSEFFFSFILLNTFLLSQIISFHRLLLKWAFASGPALLLLVNFFIVWLARFKWTQHYRIIIACWMTPGDNYLGFDATENIREKRSKPIAPYRERNVEKYKTQYSDEKWSRCDRRSRKRKRKQVKRIEKTALQFKVPKRKQQWFHHMIYRTHTTFSYACSIDSLLLRMGWGECISCFATNEIDWKLISFFVFSSEGSRGRQRVFRTRERSEIKWEHGGFFIKRDQRHHWRCKTDQIEQERRDATTRKGQMFGSSRDDAPNSKEIRRASLVRLAFHFQWLHGNSSGK